MKPVTAFLVFAAVALCLTSYSTASTITAGTLTLTPNSGSYNAVTLPTSDYLPYTIVATLAGNLDANLPKTTLGATYLHVSKGPSLAFIQLRLARNNSFFWVPKNKPILIDYIIVKD